MSEKTLDREKRYQDGFRVMQGKREFVTYPDNSSFRMWYSDTPWRYESHLHSAVEMVLTLEGSVEYVVGDQTYRIEKDEILIIPPHVSHALNMEEGSSRLLFLFEPETISSLRDIKSMMNYFNRTFYLQIGTAIHERAKELLLHAAELYREQDRMWNTLCHCDVLQIYALLGQQYLGAAKARNQTLASVDSEVIMAALTYINGHYQQDLTLDDVANFSGFSRYYFSRSFKKQTGYSFKDYLSQKRLQNASDLLIRTNKSMREVAEESGFGSVATFNRVFRERKNCTPTQYRAIYGDY